LTGEELWPPSLEPAAFLTSKEVDFDAAEVFGLPKGRAAWTDFFFGEGELDLVARSKQKINITHIEFNVFRAKEMTTCRFT